MSPEQRKIQELEQKVNAIIQVLDVPFIENVKRRAVTPVIQSLGLDNIVAKDSAQGTGGTTQSVNEAGTNTYIVAAEYDGTLTVTTSDGASYKLGYYTP